LNTESGRPATLFEPTTSGALLAEAEASAYNSDE
jgi:hypothetical protein